MQKQIAELQKYCNYLDGRIARYKKAGRPVKHLQQNKADAKEIINELEQAKTGNAMVCLNRRSPR